MSKHIDALTAVKDAIGDLDVDSKLKGSLLDTVNTAVDSAKEMEAELEASSNTNAEEKITQLSAKNKNLVDEVSETRKLLEKVKLAKEESDKQLAAFAAKEKEKFVVELVGKEVSAGLTKDAEKDARKVSLMEKDNALLTEIGKHIDSILARSPNASKRQGVTEVALNKDESKDGLYTITDSAEGQPGDVTLSKASDW